MNCDPSPLLTAKCSTLSTNEYLTAIYKNYAIEDSNNTNYLNLQLSDISREELLKVMCEINGKDKEQLWNYFCSAVKISEMGEIELPKVNNNIRSIKNNILTVTSFIRKRS